ncbi:B-cell receptor CD22 [Girardinichthys multiradiatus]|uniref:B-cell receptor CD22 n=1 Tax=Girardinichthys multiradiatus TaxID=208333 RepID=UPI001FAB7E92|nr:B-cell receptor CD22 [Girardinichthys multiradiatus]
MKMNTLFVKWVIVLLLIKANFHYCKSDPFTLINSTLTAMERSCIEIKCNSDKFNVRNEDRYWFWMKDANWTQDTGFVGTIIFSSDELKHSVSPQFKNRVQYISSPSSGTSISEQMCDILICDLRKTDSGLYQFRFVLGHLKWATPPLNLTVQENPCILNFSQPPVVTENKTVTLTCSTLISCNSDLQINTLKELPSAKQSSHNTNKTINFSFTASWEDDGRVFSCQTQENKDKFLIRNITLTVEYAPKFVTATIGKESVKEGDTVTLTCSAKGQPNVNFTWFKNDRKIQIGQLFESIFKESDSGSYHCEAQNKWGAAQSDRINIDVLYPPAVEIQIEKQTQGHFSYIKGHNVTIVCNVNRSHPKHTNRFTWIINGKTVRGGIKYVFPKVKPEDSGSYQCRASNSVGSGTSASIYLDVLYKPESEVSISPTDNKVKANSLVKFTCNTQANPVPLYSWFSYKQSDPSNWTLLGSEQDLKLESVQRKDEGCYICNASNQVGNGNISQPKCIQVIFPPTNVLLSLVSKVKEGQLVKTICTVESFPFSEFELKRSLTSDLSTSKVFSFQLANEQNVFTHTFNATSTHAGFYTCVASNSEGNNRSTQRKLEVEYSPKDVRIEAWPGLAVKENETFKLSCGARSNPPITQYKWKTENNNKKEITVSTERTYTVNSSRPSDSGLYICEVQNVIGRGKSKVEINIKYAPKQTTIIKGEEQQRPEGRRSVKLSCSSHSYPSAKYIWYNKTENKQISSSQNLTVYSHQAGEYYCSAQNEMGRTESASVRLFDDTVMKIVKIFVLLCVILLIIVVFLLYMHRRTKANQPRTTNLWPCCSCSPIALSCQRLQKRSERSTRNENILTDSRSRDDLLPEQHRRPNVEHQQPRPDVQSTSHHVNNIYCTVNMPYEKQAPSAQRPVNMKQRCMEDDSLNYASLHFENKKTAEVESLYSQLCKPKPYKQKSQENLDDYENLNMKSPIKVPYIFDDDTETSDEEEVNYTQVNIIQNPSAQSDTTDSSTSEDETHYSDVKL